MTLIDGDKIITAEFYDDEHEEFIEKEMSIIDFINTYTDEGVIIADDVLENIKAEIKEERDTWDKWDDADYYYSYDKCLEIIDKYKTEVE